MSIATRHRSKRPRHYLTLADWHLIKQLKYDLIHYDIKSALLDNGKLLITTTSKFGETQVTVDVTDLVDPDDLQEVEDAVILYGISGS